MKPTPRHQSFLAAISPQLSAEMAGDTPTEQPAAEIYLFRSPSATVAGIFFATAISLLGAQIHAVRHTTVAPGAGKTEVVTAAAISGAKLEHLRKVARSLPYSAMIAESIALQQDYTDGETGGVE